MFKEWPVAVIIAVVLAFAFLFWLVEFKGIVPSEVGFGNAKVKFTETQVKEAEPVSAESASTNETVKPNLPAAQNALSKPEAAPQPETTTANNASKPAGLTARQAMTKYFQYLQDGQYAAAYSLFKAQENGTKQSFEEFEAFWKALPTFKWTVTKDYESGNFAWVDLTLNHANAPKPQTWKYSFKRNTQIPELKPFGYWGVSNIEAH
ncbi:MAG: hypothetical protein WAQ53_08895 [Thiofilum sp.]|uniref:hypothetical protein n=1 Tax=Thiofilum sp. TaxID=2212733 RepID=UPI0025D351F0|nr:hypothetical protein [Thiofilum sp.]MBK8452778.1 hypothetical protein [Thiofilum sp.]